MLMIFFRGVFLGVPLLGLIFVMMIAAFMALGAARNGGGK